MKQPHRGDYPANWPEIARQVKEDAHWCCVRCGHPHDPVSGRTLTVHHLDADKGNVRWWNLAALCQACHLSVQGRVIMTRPWMFGHSPWFQPYVAGFYAWTYAGRDLSRDEVMDELPELLALGRQAVGIEG